MTNSIEQTIYFYNQHPISCEIIVSKLRASRGHLDGLRPEELSVHDQDHYGGVSTKALT
jgi:sarcosine/dimethylglycine N-methyltransferase